MPWRIRIFKARAEKTRKLTVSGLTPDEIASGGRLQNYRIVVFKFLEVNNPKMRLNQEYKVALIGPTYDVSNLRSAIKDLIAGTPELDPWDDSEEMIT